MGKNTTKWRERSDPDWMLLKDAEDRTVGECHLEDDGRWRWIAMFPEEDGYRVGFAKSKEEGMRRASEELARWVTP